MSEKRFKKMDTIIDPFPIWDTVEEKGYNCTDTLDLLVDLLNVMNDTLLKQAYENHKLSNKNIEQQAIICKLQDLCGESDGENAKLRIKNKELQDKIDILCEKYEYPNNKRCEK